MRALLVSWNVHGFVGTDGVRDPARTFEAIRRLDADVVALQEAEGVDWQALAAAAGFDHVVSPTKSRTFGNAILTRSPILRQNKLDLSVTGREPRGALDATLSLPGGPLRVVTTHLGLRAAERRMQATRLADHLEGHEAETPLVLLGDLNDWTPWGLQVAPLRRAVGPLSRLRTFPSRRPLVPLDRVALRARDVASRVEVARDPVLRVASDHLPLKLALRGSRSG